MELADLPLPGAAERAALDARLGTVEPRPGYVVHHDALKAHRPRGYRGEWFRGQRITIPVAAIDPAVLAALEAA